MKVRSTFAFGLVVFGIFAAFILGNRGPVNAESLSAFRSAAAGSPTPTPDCTLYGANTAGNLFKIDHQTAATCPPPARSEGSWLLTGTTFRFTFPVIDVSIIKGRKYQIQ